MTTIFSRPVELTDPYPNTVAYQNWESGGIARIADDVAVAAWMSQVEGDVYTQPMHLRGVRYTLEGPEVGPLLNITSPPQIEINDVVVGRAGEVWVIAERRDSSNAALMFGRVTIDLDTLALSHTWVHVMPSGGSSFRGVIVESWPEEDLIVVATNDGITSLSPGRALLMLVHMDTGEVTAWKPGNFLDASGNDTAFFGLALHKPSQTLLVSAERLDATDNMRQASVYRVAITPTSLGSWELVGDLPTTYRSYYNAYRWTTTVAVPNGWLIVFMDSFLGWVRVATVSVSGPIVLGEVLSTNASYSWSNNYPRPYDLVYDEGVGRAISTFRDWEFHFDETPMSQGIAHIELSPAGDEIERQALPGTFNVNYFGLFQIAVVASGHYLYLVACDKLTKPTAIGSFSQSVFAAGPDIIAPGGQGEETRRTFRRVP